MIGRQLFMNKRGIGLLVLGLVLVSLMGYSQQLGIVYAVGDYSSTIPAGGNVPVITTAIDGSGALIAGLANDGVTVLPGQPGIREFQITDSDAADPVGSNVQITNVTLGGPQPGAFAVSITNLVDVVLFTSTAPAGLPIDVTANGSVKVKVTCNFNVPGNYTATLSIDHDSLAVADPAVYNLSCNVIAPGVSVTPPSPLNINTTVLGLDSSGNPNNIIKISVAEAGNSPATLVYSANLTPGVGTTTELEIIDDGPDLTDGPVPIINQAIPDGNAARNISVRCTSAIPGTFSATVRITTNAPAPNQAIDVGINCTVAGVPKFSSVPTPGSLIDFGSTQINVPVNQFVRVTNTPIGNVPLTITNIFSSNAGVFQVQPPTSASIANGIQQDFEIRCRPTGLGVINGTLTIVHNNDGITTNSVYNLTCNGTAQEGVYTATTTVPDGVNKNLAPNNTINLGNALVGADTTFTAFTIRNAGSGTLFITSPDANPNAIRFTTDGTTNAVMAPPDPEFRLTTTTTTPRDLTPGQTFDVGVICKPTVAGQRTVKISVFFSPGTSPVTYTLVCNGTTPTPTINVAPNPLNITGVVNSNVSQNIAVTNTGGANLQIDSITISSNPVNILQITSPTLPLGAPIVITPGGAATNIAVRCSLTAATTSASGTVTINHNAGTGSTSIPVNCNTTGVVGPGISTNPTSAVGLTISTTASVAQTGNVVVTSTGGSNLSISNAVFTPANAGSGAVLSLLTTPTFPIALAPSGTQNFQFRCSSTSNGTFSGSFVITHNAPSAGTTTTITVTCNVGTVVAAPIYTSSPSTGGTISINAPLSTAGTGTLTISNTGTAPLVVSQPSLSGATSQITLTSAPSFPATVAAGSSLTLTFSCTSSTASSFTATVSIVHTAPGTPASYTVSCTVANVTATPSSASGTATATGAPVAATSVAPCSDNQVLSTPFPQNASGEFLLTNCFIINTGGTVSVTLAQVLTNPYEGVTEANRTTIQSNAGLMSVWRMGSWFLVPDLTYNPATQTYTFTSASGTNIYVFFYGGITQPVGSQSSSFAGTTTGNVQDVSLDDRQRFPLAAVISTAVVGFGLLVYALRRVNRSRSQAI
jgi:hypothetical protein